MSCNPQRHYSETSRRQTVKWSSLAESPASGNHGLATQRKNQWSHWLDGPSWIVYPHLMEGNVRGASGIAEGLGQKPDWAARLEAEVRNTVKKLEHKWDAMPRALESISQSLLGNSQPKSKLLSKWLMHSPNQSLLFQSITWSSVPGNWHWNHWLSSTSGRKRGQMSRLMWHWGQYTSAPTLSTQDQSYSPSSDNWVCTSILEPSTHSCAPDLSSYSPGQITLSIHWWQKEVSTANGERGCPTHIE